MSSILDKISPWPWHVYLRVPSTGVESCQHEYVAECDDGNINLDKAELNARMIAAAPELLDALEKVREVFRKTEEKSRFSFPDFSAVGPYQDGLAEAERIVDAAIAKVEGEKK